MSFHKLFLSTSFATLAGLLAIVTSDSGLKNQDHHEHQMTATHFDVCAKSCADCSTQCASCFNHCALLVADGNQSHVASMRICNDCEVVCSAAATLSARRSDMAVELCEACVKSCKRCAEVCGKFESDEHMMACKKSCDACIESCLEMIEAQKK